MTTGDHLYGFVRQVAGTFATRVSLVGVGLATSVVIARILGPEGRGLYAVAGAVGALGVQFGNLGLHASNSFAVARDPKLLPRLLGNTLWLSFAAGGGLAALAYVIFRLAPGIAPLSGPLLPLSLAWIPFGLAYLLLLNLLIGVRKVREFNTIELGNRLLSILLVALLILLGRVTVASVYLAGFAALIVCCLWSLASLEHSWRRPPPFSPGLFTENIRYGVKAYLAAFFAYLVLRIDVLMVKYILGPAETGYYSVAASMGDLVYMLPAAVGTILFPRLSAMGGDAERWAVTRKVALYLGGIMLLMVAVAVPLARPAVRLLYGETFLPAVPSFVILAVGVVFYGVNNVYSNCLAAMGFPWFAVNVWLAMAALNVGLNLFLIREWGIAGAAASSLVCYLALMLAQYAYLARKERQRARQA